MKLKLKKSIFLIPMIVLGMLMAKPIQSYASDIVPIPMPIFMYDDSGEIIAEEESEETQNTSITEGDSQLLIDFSKLVNMYSISQSRAGYTKCKLSYSDENGSYSKIVKAKNGILTMNINHGTYNIDSITFYRSSDWDSNYKPITFDINMKDCEIVKGNVKEINLENDNKVVKELAEKYKKIDKLALIIVVAPFALLFIIGLFTYIKNNSDEKKYLK